MERLNPVDTRIFSKNQILWRGRHKMLGSGAEVLMGFRAIDSVKADFVLGVVVLSEHCDGVAVCDSCDFAGDWLGVGVCGWDCQEDCSYFGGAFQTLKIVTKNSHNLGTIHKNQGRRCEKENAIMMLI